MLNFARFCLFFMLLGLGSCTNFRPLYGTTASGSRVAVGLASVTVAEQRSRAGQLVRNEVLSSTQTDNANRFELRIVPVETNTAVSELAGTNTKRKRYKLTVGYELNDVETNVILTKGTSFSNVSYDVVREPVADLQAANNAMARAAQEVGQDLRLRVAAYLSSTSG